MPAVALIQRQPPHSGEGIILNGLSRAGSNHQDRRELMKNAGELFYATHHSFDDDADTGLAGGLLELGQGPDAV